MSKPWIKWAIAVPVALLVLATGGTWIYINVLRDDAPERLTLEASGDTATTTTGAGVTATTAPAAGTNAGTDGVWKVATGSQAGYRVKEILFGQSTEAVGRTDKVTGSFTVSGSSIPTGTFSVDMTSVSSDQSRRDGQFHGRIMDTARFPTATFTLTKPIVLSSIPAAGGKVEASATGDLTLHGTTKSVTFTVQAQREAAAIKVAGTIPITFADYGIDNPSGGPAQVGDNGELEFLLVFHR